MATPGQKEREAELYAVLKTGNLLDYYPSFIEQGGDDVQQFCDATEDEFKEIVGLVGMSTKPLHTRRLQKALVEWRSKSNHASERITPGSWMDKWCSSPQVNRTSSAGSSSGNANATPTSSGRKRRGSAASGKGPTPEKRVVELKLPPMEVIIDWEKLDPERQQLIRDHSRIYGRDIKKRKTNALNSHEQMINEAAAQLCLRDPTLLVRRDELFTMARRVVRDSGFTFVHGHSRSKFASESDEEDVAKKNQTSQANKLKRQERLGEIDRLLQNNKELQEQIMQKLDEARSLNAMAEVTELQGDLSKLQNQQVSLQIEHKELKKKQRRSERYYTNKATRDVGSQNNNIEGDDVGEMVGDVSLQEELTPDERSEEGLAGEPLEEESRSIAVEQPRTIQDQQAVVTQILPPASGIPTTPNNSASLPQRQEPLNPEEESSVRALYTAFMPTQLQHEVVQQVQPSESGPGITYSPSLVSAAVSTDATINALLSLGAKDKVLLPGMPGLSAVPVGAVPVTAVTSSVMSPGITVVMPGQPLPGNVQWS